MDKQQKRKVCSYYARGKCVKDDCPFVHQAETKKPCKFWVETGYCRKGKNCQFYHGGKEQQKKDKKFLQKRKDQGEQKFGRNYTGGVAEKQKKRLQQINTQQQPSPTQPTISKNQPLIDPQTALKLQQQLLKQLQSPDDQNDKLQFFKLYPKTFPDHSKTLQSKQHIKQLQQRYFKQKPFLQLLKQLPTKEEQEYYQVIRRYQDSFRLEKQQDPKVYVVNVRPLLFNKEMSMHFVFQESFVTLRVDQTKYPEERATFEILNQSIPLGYKKKFIELLNKYHLKHNVFETLKFFQNSFQKNYETVKSRLENQHFKKVELKQKIQSHKEKIRKQQQAKQQSLVKEEKDSRKKQTHSKKQQTKNIHNQQQQEIQERKQRPQRQQYVQKQQPKPTTQKLPNQPIEKQKIIKEFRDYYQLQFNHLQKPQHQNLNDDITVQSLVMHNCPYLLVEKILLYVECNCSKVLMFLFDAQERKDLKLWLKLKCKKCNDCVRIVWQRQVIHNKGQLISKMSFANGKLIDVGGLGWKIGCNCDAEIIKPKLYLPGEKMQLNCHQCFSNMNVTYNGIKNFNPFVKEFQLQQDKELPLKGACNHDKLSFRWIRYACCGRPFACDECHDLGAVKEHEIVNGLTMICGHCAYEQNIGDQCEKCKKDLLKGQDKAGHWQGGLGCRDQTLLSKKDAKKYAGMGKVESHIKKKKEK